MYKSSLVRFSEMIKSSKNDLEVKIAIFTFLLESWEPILIPANDDKPPNWEPKEDKPPWSVSTWLIIVEDLNDSSTTEV